MARITQLPTRPGSIADDHTDGHTSVKALDPAKLAEEVRAKLKRRYRQRRTYGTGGVSHWVNKTTGKHYWMAQWYEDGRKKVRYFSGLKNDQGAKRKAEQFLQDFMTANGKVREAVNVSVAAYLEQWLSKRKDSLSWNGHRIYSQHISRLSDYFGDLPLQQLNRHDQVQDFIDSHRQQLSPRTLKESVRTLGQALQDAVEKEWLTKNAARIGGPFNFPKGGRRVPDLWTTAERAKFLDSLRGHPLEALLTVTYWQGLREGEVLGLQWRYIDFGKKSMRIEHQLQKNGHYQLTAPKTVKGGRTIRMHPETIRVLHELNAKREKSKEKGQFGDLVFKSRTGTPIDAGHLRRTWIAHLQAVGLPHIRFHDLRSIRCMEFATQNIPPRVAADFFGHTDIKVTLEIYARVPSQDAFDILGRVWSDGQS